ncbi:MAG: sensor histidine kinase, partial [Raoultibacter sp.]
MSIRAYIRDRFVGIVVGVFCIALVAWMTSVLGMGVPAIIFMSFVASAACVIVLVHGYVQRRSFYVELDAAAQKLMMESQAFLVADLIDRPTFLEGEITYDILRDMGKSMNDEVIRSRTQVEEYRSYIETWIHEIKTPIAAARLMASDLRGSEAMKLRAEIDRIESYVEQALYYARSTSVEKDYAIREFSLAECVREAVKKNASFLIGKGVAPSIDVAED